MSSRSASVYSQVLIELKLNEQDVISALRLLQDVCSSSESKDFFHSPSFSIDEKFKLLKETFKSQQFPKELVQFIHVLLKNRRLMDAGLILKLYQEELDKQRNVLRGVVYSSQKMQKPDLKMLEDKIRTVVSAKEILLSNKEDASLLQDFKVKVGDYVIDISLLNRFNNLKATLKRKVL